MMVPAPKLCLSVFMVILPPSMLYAQPERPIESGVLEVGYSANLFHNVDINDARAATKVWAEILIRRVGEEAEAETLILDDLPSIVRAINAKRIDLIMLLPLEYIQVKDEIRDEVSLEPLVVGAIEGEVEDRYVLLVHRQGGLRDLDQLKDRKLVLETGGKGSIPRVWIDVLLQRNNLPASKEFFGNVEEVTKISQAVLPVFFRQADACIVLLKAFETICELNPQLEAELTVMAASPGFCRGIVCARKDIYEKRLKGLLSESLISLHTEPRGQQLLALFHTDQLVPFKPAYLEDVLTLIEEYGALKARAVNEK